MLKEYWIIWIEFFLAGVFIWGCFEDRPSPTPTPPQAIALWIDGDPVMVDVLKKMMEVSLFERGLEKAASAEHHEQILHDVIRDLSESIVLDREAARRGILDSASVYDIAGMTEEDIDYPEGFESLSQDRKIWRDRVKKRFHHIETVAVITQEIAGDVLIDESLIEAEFLKRHNDFIVPMLLELRVIRLQDPQKSDELGTKLRKGFNFSKLAEQYSDLTDEGAKGSPVLRYITDFPEAFHDTLVSLPLRAASGALKENESIYFFMIDKRHEEHALPLEQVRDTLLNELVSKERSRRFQDWMNQQISQLKIQKGTPIPFTEATMGETP